LKTIFVTGGTGFLGSYLLRYLVAQGNTDIRALKRATSSMALVGEVADQIKWIEGDILDIASLQEGMEGATQVYHCAAVVSYDPNQVQTMHEVNGTGTANVVNLALENGISKLVHVSSIAALGRSKNEHLINEATKWEQNKWNTQYAISKQKAEMEVWRGIAEGLNAAIVNPSVILGSGIWNEGTCRIFMNGWNDFPFFPKGGTGFVDVRDVAKATIALMECDIVEERFIISGENLSYQDVMTRIAVALNKKQPFIRVNFLLRELAWRAAWVYGKLRNKRPFITKETARQSARTHYYDNRKSLEQLGITYTPLQKTIEDTATQLKAAANNEFKPEVLNLVV
jgi:nucleoside-diphosphate-sugar epimerase